jgi:hypothetical protein
VIADNRFYFDHGAVFSGAGGAVDLVTAEMYQRSTKRLKTKWGAYVDPIGKSRSAINAKAGNKDRCAMKVRRRSTIVEG